jgi:hypothetical protein
MINLPTPQTKLNDTDLRFFYGRNCIVRPDQTPGEILDAIDCNFEVITSQVHHTFSDADGNKVTDDNGNPLIIDDRDRRGWFRSDNFAKLGTHGNQRTATDPGKFVEFFQKFALASEKEISLDLVGTFDGGKTFYMVSKLTQGFDRAALMQQFEGEEFNIKNLVAQQDRTVHYLVVTDYYSEQLAPRATIFSQELVCANGMSRRVTDRDLKLSHDRVNTYADVAPVLQKAFQECSAYDQIKDRLRETTVHIEDGIKVINDWCAAEKDGEKLAKQIIEIYDPANNKLIGGQLDGRGTTGWRLLNAVTQHQTHTYNSKKTGGSLRSQIEGSRCNRIQRFIKAAKESELLLV